MWKELNGRSVGSVASKRAGAEASCSCTVIGRLVRWVKVWVDGLHVAGRAWTFHLAL